jgi:pimeloyl-ACP methyl ester carboxylesterase
MSVGEHQFALNDRNVTYYEAGLHHTRTVLLLHDGIGDAKYNWYDIIPLLADDYHVLAPNLPGFGGTDTLSGNKNLSDVSAWLIEFLKSQDVEQVFVIGNGFGALIARFMAVEYPQIVAGIIMSNGGYVPDVPAAVRLIMKVPIINGILAGVLANIATSSESLDEMIHHKEVITPELLACAKANSSGYAQLMKMTAIQSPSSDKPMVAMLILWGVEDKSISLSEARKLKQTLGNAEFIEIENCGHFSHLEEPDIFEWHVKQFLTQHNAVKRNTIPGS